MNKLAFSIDRAGKFSVSINGKRLTPLDDNSIEVERAMLVGVPLSSAHPNLKFSVSDHVINTHDVCNGHTPTYMVQMVDSSTATVEFHFAHHTPCWRGEIGIDSYYDAAREIVLKLAASKAGSSVTDVGDCVDGEEFVGFIFTATFSGTMFDEIIQQSDDLVKLVVDPLRILESAVRKFIQAELTKL
jgi:hypothetical protein